MARAQWVMGVLLLLALVWAYRAAHPPQDAPRPGRGRVPLWKIPAEQVEAVEYRDGEHKVIINADWSGQSEPPYLWVDLRLPPGKGHRGKPPNAAKSGNGKGQVRAEAFKGNQRARQVVTFFSNPRASRDLGRLEALDGGEFGFGGDLRSVEVRRREGEDALRLELGRNLPGNTNVYVHSPRDGHVYVVRLRSFQILARPSPALMDRGLLAIQPGTAARIEVSDGRQARTLWRLKQAGQWGAGPDAEEPVEQAPDFIASLSNLRIAAYQSGPARESAEGQTLMEARLFEEGKDAPREVLRLYRDARGKLLARSQHTRRPVSVDPKLAQVLLRQLKGLVPGT